LVLTTGWVGVSRDTVNTMPTSTQRNWFTLDKTEYTPYYMGVHMTQ